MNKKEPTMRDPKDIEREAAEEAAPKPKKRVNFESGEEPTDWKERQRYFRELSKRTRKVG